MISAGVKQERSQNDIIVKENWYQLSHNVIIISSQYHMDTGVKAILISSIYFFFKRLCLFFYSLSLYNLFVSGYANFQVYLITLEPVLCLNARMTSDLSITSQTIWSRVSPV